MDHDTQSGAHDDGSLRAEINAAPNLQRYYDSGSPGMYMFAVPAVTDPAAVLAWFSLSNVCTGGGVTAYDDGRFVGQQQTWLGCGDKQLTVLHVAARPLDSSFTMFIEVAEVPPDDVQLPRIVGSAGTVPGAVYATPPAMPPLTPSNPVPPELLVAPSIPLTTVVDDTGRLSMAVPSTWTDVESIVEMNDNATGRPRLTAAPNLNSYYTGLEAPGANVVAFPFRSDPSALLQNLGYSGVCNDAGVQSFNHGTLSGLMQTWTACGGTATREVQLAVSPTDQSVTVFINVQLPDADNSGLQAVLSSLQIK